MHIFLHVDELERFFNLVPCIENKGTNVHFKEIKIHVKVLQKKGSIFSSRKVPSSL